MNDLRDILINVVIFAFYIFLKFCVLSIKIKATYMYFKVVFENSLYSDYTSALNECQLRVNRVIFDKNENNEYHYILCTLLKFYIQQTTFERVLESNPNPQRRKSSYRSVIVSRPAPVDRRSRVRVGSVIGSGNGA